MKKFSFLKSPFLFLGPVLVVASFFSFSLLTEKIERDKYFTFLKSETKKSENFFDLFFFKFKEDTKQKISEGAKLVDLKKLSNVKKYFPIKSLLRIYLYDDNLKTISRKSLEQESVLFDSEDSKIISLLKTNKKFNFGLVSSIKKRPYLGLAYKKLFFIFDFEKILNEFQEKEKNPAINTILLSLQNRMIPFTQGDFHLYSDYLTGPIKVNEEHFMHKKVPLENFFPGSEASLSYFIRPGNSKTLLGFKYFWEWFFSFFIFIIFIVLFIRQMWLSPLQIMEKVAERFAEGNHKIRVKRKGTFLASFIEAFNRLLDRVVESENRLNSSKQRAEKAEKTKTSFVANMSHEIRSPLHTILGMEEIMRSGPLVGDQKRFLGLLRKAGEGLLNLINNILDISKMEAGELQIENLEFELEEILHNTGDLQSIPADKKNVEIYIDINPDLPKYFKGDAFRIKQVLMNLISNAVKFTSFGEIIIRAEWNPKSNKQQDVLFSVIDSGVGISKEKVDKLFNEYFQENDYTAREFGGTGLGLAISKALVEAMGGKIGIKSVLGKGTTFFFNIPFSSSRKLEVSEIDLNGKGLSIIDVPDKFVGIMRDYFKPTGLKIITLSSTELNLKKMGSIIGPENPHIIFQTVDNVTFVERCKRHFSKREGLLYWLASGHPVYQEDFFYMRRPIHLSELKKVVGSFFGQSQIEGKNKEKRNEATDLVGNILIVDDSDEGQLVMKFFLKKTKLNIDFASDGKEGISKFKEKKYDLVLMDMQMPITNGFEATKLIREFEKEKGYPRTTIIALTAYAFKDEIEKMIAAGCDDHISKPIVKSKLLNSLKRYI